MIYNPSLDGIRAVAVVAVLGFHTTLPVFKGGFVGVDVFFVLSGFLITSILREELRLSGSIRLRRFYMRRLARLMPPLAASLVAVYVGYSLLFPDLDIGPDVIFGLLYLSDYGVPLFGAPRYITHTWSLSVEEHFYIVWPVLLIATCRLSGRLLYVLLALAYAAATAWRFADAILWDDFIRTYYRFDTRLSGMILGGLLALRPLELKAETVRAIALYSLVALAMLVLGLRWKFIPSLLIGGLAAELAAAGLIISATSRPETLSRRPCRILGWSTSVCCRTPSTCGITASCSCCGKSFTPCRPFSSPSPFPSLSRQSRIGSWKGHCATGQIAD